MDKVKGISPLSIFTIGMFFVAMLIWYLTLLKPPVKEVPENITEETKRWLEIEKITCSLQKLDGFWKACVPLSSQTVWDLWICKEKLLLDGCW